MTAARSKEEPSLGFCFLRFTAKLLYYPDITRNVVGLFGHFLESMTGQELQSMHPPPGELLQTFRNTFDGLIAFINGRHIITLPSDRRPTLQETPPFLRATTMASMDTPGPFEKVPKPISISPYLLPTTHQKKSPD